MMAPGGLVALDFFAADCIPDSSILEHLDDLVPVEPFECGAFNLFVFSDQLLFVVDMAPIAA